MTARFFLRRIGLALISVWLLSMLVFAAAQLLPGDVGRAVLGPFADPASVKLLDHQLGVDRPIYVQYASWMGNMARADFGTSLQYRVPVWSLLSPSLVNSLKLAAVAFVIVVPLSIVGGVVAALRQGRPIDRAITLGGLVLTAVPEFVSAIVLIIIFGMWLDILPVSATAPPGSGPLTQIRYLLLPSMALAMVLFGYIARMARAGTIEALEADYTRTAYLKGLPSELVLRRHVLRNALPSTIAVIATQVGYLIGGLVVIEKLFNYNGIGQRIYAAAESKDFTVLQAGVLLIGVVYLAVTLLADILYALINPRIRHGQVR